MSQFLIAISKDKPESKIDYLQFIPVEETQPIFTEAARYHGVDTQKAWAVIDRSGDTTDELFGDAAIELSQADKLSGTDLGVLLGELFRSKIGLLAWYGNSFEEAEEFASIVEVIELINSYLPSGSGEIYFYYV